MFTYVFRLISINEFNLQYIMISNLFYNITPVRSVIAMQKKTCKPAMLGRVWAASRRALSLEHTPAHQFGCCQWQTQQRPPLAYLIYRYIPVWCWLQNYTSLYPPTDRPEASNLSPTLNLNLC